MARIKRPAEEEQDLNLAPIMNMVVILIPLLLLSVVFLEVAVINITAPKLSTGGPPAEVEDEPEKLNLTVTVEPRGLRLASTGGNMPPVPGCPADGPTLCVKDGVDVAGLFRQGSEEILGGNVTDGEKKLERALAAYPWRELYNELSVLKGRFPEETIMNISADADIPFAAIVRLMDVTRYQLEKQKYDQDAAFWNAKYKMQQKGEANTPAILFGDPVLALVK